MLGRLISSGNYSEKRTSSKKIPKLAGKPYSHLFLAAPVGHRFCLPHTLFDTGGAGSSGRNAG